MESVKEFVIGYIEREYTLPEEVDVMAFNFVETGYVDSLGFIQFVALLEDEFGIVFTDEEMSSEDMKVVGPLVRLVEKKRSES